MPIEGGWKWIPSVIISRASGEHPRTFYGNFGHPSRQFSFVVRLWVSLDRDWEIPDVSSEGIITS